MKGGAGRKGKCYRRSHKGARVRSRFRRYDRPPSSIPMGQHAVDTKEMGKSGHITLYTLEKTPQMGIESALKAPHSRYGRRPDRLGQTGVLVNYSRRMTPTGFNPPTRKIAHTNPIPKQRRRISKSKSYYANRKYRLPPRRRHYGATSPQGKKYRARRYPHLVAIYIPRNWVWSPRRSIPGKRAHPALGLRRMRLGAAHRPISFGGPIPETHLRVADISAIPAHHLSTGGPAPKPTAVFLAPTHLACTGRGPFLAEFKVHLDHIPLAAVRIRRIRKTA